MDLTPAQYRLSKSDQPTLMEWSMKVYNIILCTHIGFFNTVKTLVWLSLASSGLFEMKY